ncbi:ANTAR domain-containing protein [Kineococcus arenarius]|uniref:ANTAR domain-containing protein n=1 Tax=Kineococcus sp. SYSU DK007 TaxID=3383128 RepID=UPI003D7D26A6
MRGPGVDVRPGDVVRRFLMQDGAPAREHGTGPLARPGDERAGERAELEQLRTEVAQLRVALTRRPVIDMAKGAVMAVARCDEETAFQQLSRVSQAHNVKLFDLATALLQDLPASAAGVPPREPHPTPTTVRDPRELVARHWTRV